VKDMTEKKTFVKPKIYKSEKSLAEITLGPFCSSDFTDGCDKEKKEKPWKN
jgi:hypothetical protein